MNWFEARDYFSSKFKCVFKIIPVEFEKSKVPPIYLKFQLGLRVKPLFNKNIWKTKVLLRLSPSVWKSHNSPPYSKFEKSIFSICKSSLETTNFPISGCVDSPSRLTLFVNHILTTSETYFFWWRWLSKVLDSHVVFIWDIRRLFSSEMKTLR